MREIIFRGMDVKGKWHYGNLAVLTSSPYRGVEPGSYISNSAGMPFAYQVRPETIGQYIGIEDKMGKMIFENDIVQASITFQGSMLPHCGQVIYSKEYGSFATHNEGGDTLFVRHAMNGRHIIGNIHENSDLLK